MKQPLITLGIALAFLLFFGPITVIISIIGYVKLGPLTIDLRDKTPLSRTLLAIVGFGTWLLFYVPLVSFAFRVIPFLVPPTDAPMTTPTHTPTASRLLEAAADWPVVIKESFDTNDRGWEVGDMNGQHDGRGTWSIVNGKYRWEMEATEDDFMRSTVAALEPLPDFYLSVEVRLVSGPENEIRYGVLFRREGNDFYTFRIEDGPNFRVRLRRGEGEWTNLVDFTRAPIIPSGEANRLAVIADGSRFCFYIDDRFVREVEDHRLDMGNVGLLVNVNDAGEKAIVEFDEFEVRRRP